MGGGKLQGASSPGGKVIEVARVKTCGGHIESAGGP
jgi:hypothetical protein